jgi:hypothetical protein
MSTTIGDDTTPVYSFEWADGTERKTNEGVESDDAKTTAVETLAQLGREDPDCDVTLVGFE